ncbi:MAG: GntR family transcriptional regulator [Sedimentisphaeraceae bacterium JB056]
MNKEKAAVLSILDYIESENLSVGDRLLSNPRCVDELNVSINTVRRAMDRLADYGLISTQKGKGTFLAKGVSPEFREKIVDSLGLLKSDKSRLKQKVAVQETYNIKFVHKWRRDSEVFRSIYSGFEKVAASFGRRIVEERCELLNDRDFDFDVFYEILDGYDGGVLWVQDWPPEKMLEFQKMKVPHALIDLDEVHNNCVTIDNEDSVRRSVGILVAQGYENIAIFEPLSEHKGESSLKSACESLKYKYKDDANISFFSGQDYLIDFMISDEFKDVSAIYFADDVYCCRDILKLANKGLMPGENVKIITHVNKNTSVVLPDEIDKMVFDLNELGMQAAYMLLRSLENKGLDVLPGIKICGIYKEH